MPKNSANIAARIEAGIDSCFSSMLCRCIKFYVKKINSLNNSLLGKILIDQHFNLGDIYSRPLKNKIESIGLGWIWNNILTNNIKVTINIIKTDALIYRGRMICLI